MISKNAASLRHKFEKNRATKLEKPAIYLKRLKQLLTNPKFIAVAIIAILIAYGPVSRVVADYITIKDANPAMVALAQKSGMNQTGELIFLRTHPKLDTDSQMESDCSSNAAANNSNGFIEQGCYAPSTNRIYIRTMPNNLYDMEVSTAAYEMLHAVYINIDTSGQGTSLNQAIEANYQAINDTFLNSQVTAFAKTEPGARDLELFSLLGTGYSNLTNSLVNYYTPYFSSIHKTVAANDAVIQLFQQDENELSSIQVQINDYDNIANTMYNNAITAYNDSVSWANVGNQEEDDYNYNIYQRDYNLYSGDLDIENNFINSYNNVLQNYNDLVTEYNGTQPVSQTQNVQTH